MAGTSYNTIQLPQEETPKRNTAKKVATFGAVFAAVVVMFFAGRVFQESANPYTHVEVMNLAEMCDEGSYIGACVACKECATYEYANGGCSFFKDTFCSYCEPIENCKRENVECTSRLDQKCNECDCNDEIVAWTDVEVSELNTRGYLYADDSTPMSCYFGEDCKPCRVCPKGSFQTAKCTQTVDTQCQECSACSDDQFVKTPCSYSSNTVCEDCYHCDAEGKKETTDKRCVRWAENPSVHFQGTQTKCRSCAEVEEGNYVTKVCSENSDTQQDTCSFCEDGNYPTDFCAAGSTLVEGADTVCAQCTPGREGVYETYKCDKAVSRDAEFDLCTSCVLGQWQQEPCHDLGADGLIHESPADTICPTCTDIANCAAEVTSCENAEDQQCNGCVKIMQVGGVFDDCCDEGFRGLLCEYQIFDGQCGTNTYRQRNAQSMKFFKDFEAEQNVEFVKQCKLMCDEFSDCVAFEVEDAVLEDGAVIQNTNICNLKNTKSNLEELAASDDEFTCYYNLHRTAE